MTTISQVMLYEDAALAKESLIKVDLIVGAVSPEILIMADMFSLLKTISMLK